MEKVPGTPLLGAKLPATPFDTDSPSGKLFSSCSGALVASSSSSLLAFAAQGSTGGASAAQQFNCPKCKRRLPVAEAVQVGNQTWCVKDRRTYGQLQTRWAKNPKLRTWWNSMTDEEQQTWFLKWQSLTPKARFQQIQYVEKVSLAEEVIEDEVEDFKTYARFHMERKMTDPSATDSAIEADWLDIIDSCRSECLWRRGQWLVPSFNGVRRKKRNRHTGQERTRTDKNGQERTRTNKNAQERTRTDKNGQERTRTDNNGRERARTDERGRQWTRADENGRERSRTDKSGREGLELATTGSSGQG